MSDSQNISIIYKGVTDAYSLFRSYLKEDEASRATKL
jgi:hypothetical protein